MNGVFGASREHLRERALAGAVRAHDGMHLAGRHFERQAIEDAAFADRDHEILDAEHGCTCSLAGCRQPTAPSRLTLRRFCASTANSIGSSLNTALQKPFTIMLTASSSEMPRCRQ